VVTEANKPHDGNYGRRTDGQPRVRLADGAIYVMDDVRSITWLTIWRSTSLSRLTAWRACSVCGPNAGMFMSCELTQHR